MSEQKPISRMRGLGRFVGHMWGAINPSKPGQETVEVRREVEQEEREGVILRRTTIEEVEIRPGAADTRAPENNA